MPEWITVKERHMIYETTLKLISILKTDLEEKPGQIRKTPQLLNRLVNAAMTCPGFTVNQKDNIGFVMNLDESDLYRFGLPRLPHMWAHQYSICTKANAPADVIEVCYAPTAISLLI